MPHPEAMTRIANCVLYSERESLSLHVISVLFPDYVSTDEERVQILKQDSMERFKIVQSNIEGATTYSVGLTRVSEEDQEVVHGVNKWKDNMAQFLCNMPGHSIPLSLLISECNRPASVSRDLRIKDALRVDCQDRFELFGQSDTLYVSYKLNAEEVEQFKEDWRGSMEKFLVLSSMRKVPLSILGSSVEKPAVLKKGIKISKVIDEDPKKRFVVTEYDQKSNIAFVGLAISELERAKEKWRLKLAMQLSSPPFQCPMTTIGGAVPRPLALGRNVTLVDVINSDPQNRFELGGSNPKIFVRLRMPHSTMVSEKGKVASSVSLNDQSEGSDGWITVGGSKKHAGENVASSAMSSGGSVNGKKKANKAPSTNVWASGRSLAAVARQPKHNVETTENRLSDDLLKYSANYALQEDQVAKPDSDAAHVFSIPLPVLREQNSVTPPLFADTIGINSNGTNGTIWNGRNGWGAISIGGADLLRSNGEVDLGDVYGQQGAEVMKSINDFFGAVTNDPVLDNEEVMPSFLKKEKTTTGRVIGKPGNTASCVPESNYCGARTVILQDWLPEVLEGFPPSLISTFSEKLSEEGFIRFVSYL